MPIFKRQVGLFAVLTSQLCGAVSVLSPTLGVAPGYKAGEGPVFVWKSPVSPLLTGHSLGSTFAVDLCSYLARRERGGAGAPPPPCIKPSPVPKKGCLEDAAMACGVHVSEGH